MLLRLPLPLSSLYGDASCSGCCATETLPTDRPTRSGRSPKKGEEQSRAAGRALKKLGVQLERMPYEPEGARGRHRRARLRGARAWSRSSSRSWREARSTPEALAAGLGDDVLLVGHDPDFSMAVHALTGAQVRMKKGGLAGIEKGELKVLLRPDETRSIAK